MSANHAFRLRKKGKDVKRIQSISAPNDEINWGLLQHLQVYI